MFASWPNVDDEKVNGTVVQTLDFLDFMVINLSGFERLQRSNEKFIKRQMRH